MRPLTLVAGLAVIAYLIYTVGPATILDAISRLSWRLAIILCFPYAVTATLDDDLQNPPEELPRLLAALGPDLDVVYGTPERQRHGFWRVVASRTTRWVLAESMGQEAARRVSAFRVLRTRLRDAFADYTGPFVSLDALLTWGSQRFGAVSPAT